MAVKNMTSAGPYPNVGLCGAGSAGAISVARLRSKHGDARLTDLRRFLVADWPKRDNGTGTDCKAVFDPPPDAMRSADVVTGKEQSA